MLRIFFQSSSISGKFISITSAEQIHHARDVLRIKPLSLIEAVDEKGAVYGCLVSGISPEALRLEVTSVRKKSVRNWRITVACALPKNSKFDDIVDKLTQLGVECVIPMHSQRVIVKLDPKKEKSRVLRWRKIAENASQQSKRNSIPFIDEVKTFEEVSALGKYFDFKLIPTLENADKQPFKKIFAGKSKGKVLILIGPEGDFSQEEVALALNAGFLPVTMGDLVLRVETAAAAASFFAFHEDN